MTNQPKAYHPQSAAVRHILDEVSRLRAENARLRALCGRAKEAIYELQDPVQPGYGPRLDERDKRINAVCEELEAASEGEGER